MLAMMEKSPQFFPIRQLLECNDAARMAFFHLTCFSSPELQVFFYIFVDRCFFSSLNLKMMNYI